MKAQMSESEQALRSQFDFSKATRGGHTAQYAKGRSVTFLTGEPEAEDSSAVGSDSQLVEIAGKHLLISRLVAAGYEVAEPLRDRGIDLIVYRDKKEFSALPVQMKASTQESFSLDRKYEKFSNLLIAYVWNVNAGEKGDVYLLTFEQALKVMDAKGYSKTDSWIKNGYYFVRNAGRELKELLQPYRMQMKKGSVRPLVVGG
ncbi:MAG: hypothetical protein ACLGSD_19655 [Acidobacteriota bacterium]